MTRTREASPGPDQAGPDQAMPAQDSVVVPEIGEALACLENGLHGEAIQVCERVLAEQADCTEAIYLLGLIAFDLEDPMGAIRLLERAHSGDQEIQEYAEALAAIYVQLGKVNEGLFYAKLATTLSPHPTIRGLLPERFGSFFKNLDRSYPYYYRDRAALKLARGAFEEAAADCQRQLDLFPGDMESLRILAQTKSELGQFESALAASHAALHAGPTQAEDLSLTARILADAGRLEEAMVCHQAAIETSPGDAGLHSRGLANQVRDTKATGASLEAAHRDWAQHHAGAIESRNTAGKLSGPVPGTPPESALERDAGEPLRIAYLCGGFHDGDLMTLFEPVLRGHDRGRVQVFCYAEGRRHDVATEGLMRQAHKWSDTSGIDDRTLTRILQGDGIDIAVDLSGHHEGGRPLLFAHGPAPVTLTWLGYAHPLGLSGRHGFFTDPIAWPEDPSSQAKNQQEKIYRLPQACFALERPGFLPEVAPLPALKAGHLTFGLSCDLGLIGPSQAAAWSGPLRAVEGARLLICNRFNQDGAAIERCLSLFSHLGLRDRVDVVNMADNFESTFAFYDHIDLALDPGQAEALIENGRALWMGVPLLSLAGERHGTRLGASLLHHAGQSGWVADDTLHLSEIAWNLSLDLDGLARLRQGLREDFARSPVTDTAGFTRALEDTYRALLEKSREGSA